MKKIILTGLFFLLYFVQTEIRAQQITPTTKDSLSIEALLKMIETNSSYRIYTGDIDASFKVSIQKINAISPLDMLKKALTETPYRVSVYGNNLFILKEKELATYFPYTDSNRNANRETGFFAQIENKEKATSENKVYIIGDQFTKSLPAKITLKGKINDSKTGEPLIGVSVVQKEPYIAAVTDSKGDYIIELPSGRVQLELSGFNIKNSRRNLMLYGNGVFNIELIEEILQLNEVTVIAGRIDNIRNIDIGVEKIQIDKIKNIPTVMGEVDILRVLQTLPGVKTVGEASTGFNVRGGATDQNLILLNNGTIYNPNHLFGFFSAFSSDMIKEAEIYKSSIPAQYGGRISSILDITGKEANKEKFTGSAGLGLVTSKLNLEIPILKEKTSLLLSGRTTYSDWILKSLPQKSGYSDGTAGFYDVGTVFSHKIDDKNLVNIYGYFSRDRFAFSVNEKYAYTNLNASAKWRRLFNNKLIGNFSTGYDHYDYENKESKNEAAAFKLSFNINQVFAKADFSYIMNEHKLDFGAKSTFYSNNAGTYDPLGEISLVKYDVLQQDKALESALYISDQWELTPNFSVDVGIRYSIFNAIGPRTYYRYNSNVLPSESTITDTLTAGSGRIFKTYHEPEFRLSARYIIQDNLSVKVGFNTMQQYIHKLSNTVIMSPTDTWKLSDANIRPQKGWQAATGLYFNSSKRVWETSLEVYYKKMNDYLDYRSGARILMNHHIETDVVPSEGHAYGVELMVKKPTGKLNGWASYTYSRTFLRQHDKIVANPVNRGEWYPTDYDKPHDFKLVGNYKMSQRYSFSMNIDYSTGRPTTIPAGKYYDSKLNSYQVFYTDRNSYRVPDYFRSDVSFNIEPSHKLTLLTHHTLSIGAYNVTGRRNVYSIYYVTEGGKINGYQLSIFGTPIPFITYNIKF
jgi:hypothetical protein